MVPAAATQVSGRRRRVVGHGGISWEMTRQLVEHLPAMVTPRWLRTRTQPIGVSDVVRYALSTVTTRNPALVLAASVMGALFAAQRRASGGIQAPVLTHVTWSALVLRCLPPLFRDRTAAAR